MTVAAHPPRSSLISRSALKKEATPRRRVPGSRSTGRGVWEHVWRERPGRSRDRALLEREKQSDRWAMIVDRLEATYGSIRGLKTIELGSGRGDLSALLAEQGACVTLLDASEAALRQARQRFEDLRLPARFVHGDIFAAQSEFCGRFDVALSSGLVEHFRGADRTRLAYAHYAVLRPGGTGIISVPNASCLPYRMWKCYLELRGWWPYGMELPFTPRELTRRARRAGFVRTETRCFAFRQAVACAVRTIMQPLPFKLGLHRGSHQDLKWISGFARRNVIRSADVELKPTRAADGRRSSWSERPSRLDRTMGLVLLLFAWR